MNTYVGGDIDVYKETIEHDRLLFPVVEGIAKSYGYKSGDLIYYLLPSSTLRNGLKLIISNFDVHEMVQAHSGLPIIELYIISFSESIPDIGEENIDDDNGDDEGGYSRIEQDDPYWDEVDEPDLFVENNDIPGPSMRRDNRDVRVNRDDGDNRNVGGIGGEGREDSDGGEGEESGEDEESEEGGDDSGRSTVDDDDANSDMARSDILTSPPKSDEEYEVDSQRKHITKWSEFHLTDMGNNDFVVGQKFSSIQVFRDAVRESNVNMEKDVKFKKNYLAKCVVVCKDTSCKYRIYGHQCKYEESFEVRSFQPVHSCRRKHKNSILKSKWIVDKFRAQPNMPVKAIVEEVKDRWGVDVKEHRLYRARRLAKDMIRGKMDEQYNKLWD
jgi:hypothetical protein